MKLLITYEKLLPCEARDSSCEIILPQGTNIREALKRFYVPADESTVILVNGRSSDLDDTLNDGDVLCAFPAATGG